MTEAEIAAVLAARQRLALPPARRDAAVLMPLFRRDGGWWLLFTERSPDLASHAGQISFPGGRAEPEDGGPVGTALRESHEEIGLRPSDVRVLGLLDDVTTVYDVRVTPVVGVIPAPYDFRPDPREVAGMFSLPVAFFTKPAARRIEIWRERHEVVFFDRDPDPPVWGLTAGILARFLDEVQIDGPDGEA